tara:strand:+ start:537 stop:911 length:375 start_codon:yes stop_codon:yes gene_type:complete
MKRKLSELTVKQVDITIRALAAEYPDFVYNKTGKQAACFYDKGMANCTSNKGCIFGQAFQRLGVDTSSLGMESIGKLWRDTHESTFTDENDESECPYDWLAVQQVQDKGGTWGEAIQELPRHKI